MMFLFLILAAWVTFITGVFVGAWWAAYLRDDRTDTRCEDVPDWL